MNVLRRSFAIALILAPVVAHAEEQVLHKGRYQLLEGTFDILGKDGRAMPYKRVLKMDTETGHVWQLTVSDEKGQAMQWVLVDEAANPSMKGEIAPPQKAGGPPKGKGIESNINVNTPVNSPLGTTNSAIN